MHASLSMATSDYELRDSWIADTGSDTHICNDLSRFYTLQECTEGEELCFGNSSMPILGFRMTNVIGDQDEGKKATLSLSEVAYIPGLHTNIVSMQRAKCFGIFHNGRLNRLEDSNGDLVCHLHSIQSQDVIEYNPQKDVNATPAAFTMKKSENEPHSTADAAL